MGRGECYAKAARLDAEIGYGAASLLLDSVRGLRAGDPAGAAGGTLTRGGAAGCARVLSAAVRGALSRDVKGVYNGSCFGTVY